MLGSRSLRGRRAQWVSRRQWMTTVGGFLWWGCSQRVSGARPNAGGDDLWLVNTRRITSSALLANLDNPSLQFSRLDGDQQYQPSSLIEFCDASTASPELPTVIYVHGNRFTHQEAIERGWYIYQQVCRARRGDNPWRFLVWSWPSEPSGLILHDVRTKAQRTDTQGLYLAWFLRNIASSSSSITLIGYSFGGRVVTGALHALAGGSLGMRSIPNEPYEQLGAKVALIAAAIDANWLSPGRYHERAVKNTASLTLMYNPQDSVLKRYWLLDRRDGSRALGVVGKLSLNLPVDASPIPVQSINCNHIVGSRHNEIEYFSDHCRAGKILAELIESDMPPKGHLPPKGQTPFRRGTEHHR